MQRFVANYGMWGKTTTPSATTTKLRAAMCIAGYPTAHIEGLEFTTLIKAIKQDQPPTPHAEHSAKDGATSESQEHSPCQNQNCMCHWHFWPLQKRQDHSGNRQRLLICHSHCPPPRQILNTDHTTIFFPTSKIDCQGRGAHVVIPRMHPRQPSVPLHNQ